MPRSGARSILSAPPREVSFPNPRIIHMSNSAPFSRIIRFSLLATCALFAPWPVSLAEPVAPPAAAAPTLPVIGPAPAWKLVALDGTVVGSEALKGKVVVVDFWATWCGPCVHEIPGYVAMQKKYAERGLVIVGLSIDRKGEAVVAPFAKRTRINYPLAIATPEVIAAFGELEAIPTTYLIDREGRIRHKKTGSMEAEDYEKLISSLL